MNPLQTLESLRASLIKVMGRRAKQGRSLAILKAELFQTEDLIQKIQRGE